MNSMERVTLTLQHKEADRVPVYPIISGAARRLVNATYPEWSQNAEICAQSFIKARKEFGLDCIVTLIDLSVECAAWGQKIIFPEAEAAHPDYRDQLIRDLDEYEKIKKVDYCTNPRMMMHLEVCKKLVEDAKGEYPVIAFVFGPLGTLSMLRNQQEMFLDLCDDPDVVRNAAFEVNETLKEYCTALMQTGIQGIMVDTLFASGSIMSKETWDALEGALVESLANHIRSEGGLVMIHNCGGKIYFDKQIERMHPDAISFLYPPADCKDFKECKEKYGNMTTLIGAVSPTNAAIGDDETWENECKEQIDIMKKDGGFILATGCEYPANADFARAKKMIELAKTYGKYN